VKRAAVVAAALLGLLPWPTAAGAASVRVFAASSLTEAFRDLGAAFERAHPGDHVEMSFAGSQVLRTQIEQGAVADVFAPADLDHAEVLRRAGLLGAYRVFATNRMVVVAPAEGRVVDLEDLARPGVRVVVAGPAVPAGRYTARVLASLAAAGLFGADYQSRVRANVVSEETNVRFVLSKVEIGEADAGFVYATDAAASKAVRVLDVPACCNVVAEYPIGVVTRSGAGDLARAFVDFVRSPAARALLAKHGFTPAGAATPSTPPE
jgi:molybdate transport system substrate-binding protein